MNYESLFKNAPCPIAILTEKGKIIEANSEFQNLTGFSTIELADEHISKCFTGKASKLLNALDMITSHEGSLEIVPGNIHHKSGGQIAVECSLGSLNDGQPLVMLSCRLLSDSDLYLKAIMEGFPGLIYFKDKQGRYTRVNSAYASKFGVKQPDDVRGKSAYDFYHPEHASKTSEAESHIIETGEPLEDTEEQETWADGKVIWLRTTRKALRNDEDEIIGTYGISMEYLRQHETDLQLIEKTSILNAITSSMPVVIYKYHQQRGIEVIMGNIGLQKSFKNSKIVKFSIATGLSTLVDKISEEKDKHGYLHFTSAGKTRSFENFVFKGHSGQGEYIGLALDVTESKRDRQKVKKNAKELVKINRELNQFAYIISHDLKAPLRAITNLSEWIQEDLGDTDNEEVRNNLRLLRNRAGRMENLINGILEYARVSRTRMKFEVIDTEEVVNDVLDTLMVPAKFKVKVSDQMPRVTFPRVNMEQLFSNLISNAVKYHDKEHGNIEIGYNDLGDYHEFFVQDDGPGIAREYHEKIFVIFQTLHARDSIESTGVGLSIVKKILEDRGGEISIESVKGKGTKFIFKIPKLVDNDAS